ncbi:hypothetical protein ACVW1A_006614 [Bradyrhizobium sp. LB1.3]
MSLLVGRNQRCHTECDYAGSCQGPERYSDLFGHGGGLLTKAAFTITAARAYSAYRSALCRQAGAKSGSSGLTSGIPIFDAAKLRPRMFQEDFAGSAKWLRAEGGGQPRQPFVGGETGPGCRGAFGVGRGRSTISPASQRPVKYPPVLVVPFRTVNPQISFCVAIAGELGLCQGPGVLERFCSGQQVRREPPSRRQCPIRNRRSADH